MRIDKDLTRNTNIEILRIIAIIMIIMHHYASHGFDVNLPYGFNKYYIDIISLFGKVGVNIFFLITGYFMINYKTKRNKIIKLITKTIFYSYTLTVLSILFSKADIILDFKTFLKCIFPVSTYHYWFISTYILLIIISPFLNQVLEHFSKKTMDKYICFFIIIWSIVPTFLRFIDITYDFNNLTWAALLYLIGGYLRKYPLSNRINFKIFFILTFFSLCISCICLNYLGHILNNNFILLHTRYFSSISSFFVLSCSISLFGYYINKPNCNNVYINYIAKTTLGIYLIHDHILFKYVIWNLIFNCMEYFYSNVLILHSFITVLFVFCFSASADFLIHLLSQQIINYLLTIKSKKSTR